MAKQAKSKPTEIAKGLISYAAVSSAFQSFHNSHLLFNLYQPILIDKKEWKNIYIHACFSLFTKDEIFF